MPSFGFEIILPLSCAVIIIQGKGGINDKKIQNMFSFSFVFINFVFLNVIHLKYISVSPGRRAKREKNEWEKFAQLFLII